ncbi:tyrosine-tRNA ligase [Chytriomyces cf. hyalinus JEL632]|nr:tyrosine-tRNA ligase [Chytriomyces cf. hyalinus JEL632]
MRAIRRLFSTANRDLLQQSTLEPCRDPVAHSLHWRGLVAATTSPRIHNHLSASSTAVYAGFDPTAKSLHVGNLLTIVALIHFAAAGHSPVALVGGATGSIGDPSGRSSERSVLSREIIIENCSGIRNQLERIFKNAKVTMNRHDPAASSDTTASKVTSFVDRVQVLDNYAWFKDFSFLDFLGSVGRLSRVSTMMSRESVKSRLDAPDGISFTEFTYQLLQAYDFHHLYTSHNVTVQIGGSDQWGNILSGIDLIRRMKPQQQLKSASSEPAQDVSSSSDTVFGLTIPLVTTASGEKFGKSAGNAVWLDPELVSPFDFYQFFRRTPDGEVERYLNYFSFLSKDAIAELMAKHQQTPEHHLPQRKLAFEVTHLVHGETAANQSEFKSQLLYDSATLTSLPTSKDIIDAFKGDDRLVLMPRDQVSGAGVCEVAAKAGAVKSVSAARKLISGGGLYVANNKVASQDARIQESDALDGRLVLLRAGKSKYTLVLMV